ncbi:MAG: PSD1 and planctomycete cytochrome C domain-containing protein [Pirellula sp.]
MTEQSVNRRVHVYFARLLICYGALVSGGLDCIGCAAETEALETAKKTHYFESKVRPLLVEHCTRCHGEEKQEGGLRLDSQTGFEKGGDSGALVGDSLDNSLLLSAIHYKDLEMPPSGKLSDEKIEVIEQWLRSGSYWPATATASSPKNTKEFTQSDREYWFFKARAATTSLNDDRSITGHIDALVQEKLDANGLAFSERADTKTLVRRAYLDLLGVTPTYAESQQFLQDPSSHAYTKLIDRLLDDPRYGERWGRFWLDLVRFAESDGYKQDDFRPTAYRYRDYVVRSFNHDKPYSDFVREQIAGDELDPNSLEHRDASGYLRLWIYEYNQRDVVGQWSAILNDITDVTGEAFLGLGYGCARCHDHKFDPLLQKDYFRLQAYFSGLIPRENLPAATHDQMVQYLANQDLWNDAAKPLLDQIEEIERPFREKAIRTAIEKFPPEVRPALRKSESERTPREKQLAHLASLQQARDVREIKWEKVLSTRQFEEWSSAKELLKQLPVPQLRPLPTALAVSDVGPEAAEVYIPGKSAAGPILPGIPSILDPESMPIVPRTDIASTGRRTALANWMVSQDNPFTWRVIVNRIWQQHFGTGLVQNASDFGRLTDPPSHPELLDFLANEFVQSGGQFKALHRWIMHSRTYLQAAHGPTTAKSLSIDPSNKWLWRFSPRRLDAEQIRDSILTVSGELKPTIGGESVAPNQPLRSIYVRAMRNSPDRFLTLFDAPDASTSTAKRNATTTPLQSLMMMNSDWINLRAERMAAHILGDRKTPEACVVEAHMRVFLKRPSANELELALKFLGVADERSESQSSDSLSRPEWQTLLIDYCHVLINSNSFLHVE